MIEKFEKIIEEIKRPYTVYSKSTKDLFSADINDNVLDKMQVMIEKSYTHIPIYVNENLVGIFSENSLFNYLYENEIVEINKYTTFNDIKNYIDLNNLKEIVKFVSKNDLYDNVVNSFIEEFKNKNKLSCVLITNSGKQTEKVIGILTTWDIIGRD